MTQPPDGVLGPADWWPGGRGYRAMMAFRDRALPLIFSCADVGEARVALAAEMERTIASLPLDDRGRARLRLGVERIAERLMHMRLDKAQEAALAELDRLTREG